MSRTKLVRTHESPDGSLYLNVGDFIVRLAQDRELGIQLQDVITQGLVGQNDPVWVLNLTVIAAVVQACGLSEDQAAAIIKQNQGKL